MAQTFSTDQTSFSGTSAAGTIIPDLGGGNDLFRATVNQSIETPGDGDIF
ncbi:hypothetical protein RDV64_14310 [Acuticoccus sp. MNP-M23]|nr:hypothetical protein [Acuticoccus sp. MNP-M23]WMS41252.1 hypothetical protein RDV64_14310 [Acuticoccus sp. MNP-M23]